MRSLRQQVDRIDLKMLQLLQKRTKLSGQIGRMKQRNGAAVYVPERERELIARLTRASKGMPPAHMVAALYREILSSSRAAQGQAPIGLLQASASVVLPVARSCFGSCDRFLPRKTWSALVRGLGSGSLSLALLTGADLIGALQTPSRWRVFLERFTVVGELSSAADARVSLAHRSFIITPRVHGTVSAANRILILIECKSTVNAIKSLLQSMPNSSFSAEHLTRPSSQGNAVALVHLTSTRPVDGIRAAAQLDAAARSAGLPISILGIYPGTENYGG
jgi:chorismate mutase